MKGFIKKTQKEVFSHINMYSTGIAPCLWFQAELKGLSRANYERMEEMKERVDGLRSAREEKRKQVSCKIGM